MPSSLCPGCGEHEINLVTKVCGACGDTYEGVGNDTMQLLRSMLKEMGPLRDALVLMVAEQISDYPKGCICKDGEREKRIGVHRDDCPASKHGDRYVEHLYRRRQEREALQRAEAHMADQERLLEKAFSDDDVEFVADLKGKLEGAGLAERSLEDDIDAHRALLEEDEPVLTREEMSAKLDETGFTSAFVEAQGKFTPKQAERFLDFALDKGTKIEDIDIRTGCPECGHLMDDDGELHVICRPCGVRLIKDVTDAEPPGTHDVEVWYCDKCDQCYTFRSVKLFPTAVIMAGDDTPPTTCFACNGPLEQWTTYRPLSRDKMLKLMGHDPDREHGPLNRKFEGRSKKKGDSQ